MKNHEYIRKQLPVKELARMLVDSEEVIETDGDMDGVCECCYVTHYTIPDGSYSYDYEDAVLHTIDWLNADYKEVE